MKVLRTSSSALFFNCCICASSWRSEEHTSELQSQSNLVCRLLLEKKNKRQLSLIYCIRSREVRSEQHLRNHTLETRRRSGSHRPSPVQSHSNYKTTSRKGHRCSEA